MLFRKPDFVQYSSVLHAVCGENSAAVLPQKTSFAVRHVFSYYIERFRKSQAHFFIFSKNSETHAESCHFIRKRGRSAGDAASILAPASRSSSSPRNPQMQPTASIPALRAVRMSTSESPIITVCSGAVPHCCMISRRISGEGFFGRLALPPRMQSNCFSPKI